MNLDNIHSTVQPLKQWKSDSLVISLHELPGTDSPHTECDLHKFFPKQPAPHLQYGNTKEDKRLYFHPSIQSLPQITHKLNTESCLENHYEVVCGSGMTKNRPGYLH